MLMKAHKEFDTLIMIGFWTASYYLGRFSRIIMCLYKLISSQLCRELNYLVDALERKELELAVSKSSAPHLLESLRLAILQAKQH